MAKLPDLKELSRIHNIAELLNENILLEIGERVVSEYDSDLESRTDWEDTINEALKIAKQVKEKKTFPWLDAASIKYPALTTAAMQFAARAYPEIVKDGKVAGCKVIGNDDDGKKQDRADRISRFLSYQLTEKIESWDEDTDKLLHVLPITGIIWRKIYQSPVKGAQSDLVLPLDVVVHYYTKSLEKCPRITHRFELYKNSIIERQRSGIYLDIDLGDAIADKDTDDTPTNTPHLFLEQHRYWDLDGDGYEEPYIITVHKDTKKVMAIIARYDADSIKMHNKQVVSITPKHYFIKYSFIPSPDGSFYDVGFGSLLNPLNASINTLINQLIDSGTLSNTGGGFIGKGARMSGGNIRFRPGEWKPIDVQGGILKDNIVQLPTPQPSQVLFNMLSLMIETVKELSTVSSEMSGQQSSPNEPATSMLARLDQGMKVFSAIHKRIYRALTKELKMIYDLDKIYLTQEEYQGVLDEEEANVDEDFEDDKIDVKPIADSSLTSSVQKMFKLQAAGQVLANVPGADIKAYAKRMLEAIGVDGIEELLPEQQEQPAPDLEMIKLQGEMKLNQAKMQIEMQKMQLDMKEAQARMNAEAKEQADRIELERKKFELEVHKMAMEMGYAKPINPEYTDLNTDSGYSAPPSQSAQPPMPPEQQPPIGVQQQPEMMQPPQTEQQPELPQ